MRVPILDLVVFSELASKDLHDFLAFAALEKVLSLFGRGTNLSS
jgi:hypothetical protein